MEVDEARGRRRGEREKTISLAEEGSQIKENERKALKIMEEAAKIFGGEIGFNLNKNN